MKVFRLCRKEYTGELNGRGASISGNRWNSKGTEIIYTAENRALAMAEVAVHLSLATLPRDYMMMEIEVPDNIKVKEIRSGDLPVGWNNHPPNAPSQKVGDNFIGSMEGCILKVPSAVVPGDFNYLINPHHKDFRKVKVKNLTEFLFDQRMLKVL